MYNAHTRPQLLVLQYIKDNPKSFMHESYKSIAKKLQVNEKTVKKIILHEIENPTIQKDNQTLSTIDEQTTTSTITQDYDKKIEDLPNETILDLQEYCKKYHIPFEQVTSGKFVNHQKQAAWNLAVDFTKISSVHLNEYFSKLKNALSKHIVPVHLVNTNLPSNDAAYCLWYSDKHVGAANTENALYGNVYNSTVFRKRMFAMLDDYIQEASVRGRFDKVYIGDLGDAVDGWDASTTRKASTHKLRQNMSNRESFDAYVIVMCEFIEALVALDLANSYEFVAVSNDNHSSDFGYICNRTVEVFLQCKFPDIKTNIFSKFIDVIDYGIHSMMLCHGKDDEYMKYGMPLNIDDKTEKYINAYIDSQKLYNRELHFIKGDLHQASTNTTRRFRYRNVMSLYGSSDYTQTCYGPNSAGTSVDIIYKKTRKVVQYEVIYEDSYAK